MRTNTGAIVREALQNSNDSSVASVANGLNDSPVHVCDIRQEDYSPGHSEREGNLESSNDSSKAKNTTTPAHGSAHNIWIQFQDVFKLVLRALGLTIIAHAFRSAFRALRHIGGRGLHEPTKKAIRKNKTVALLRCLIHLVPITFALFEIVLNWNTYYVGISIYNQAVYQVLAKIHEVAIQASLATILLSYIRHELTIGNGIPFGTLFSGLQISQVAYLWSMEFWGSLRSPYLPLTKKLVLLSLVFLSITLASLSGPSSAILLVPRQDFWPGGSTDIWVNATMDSLYPTQIDMTLVPDGCSFAPENTISNGCPSSQWEKIQEYLALQTKIVPVEYQITYGETPVPMMTEVSGKISQRQQYRELLIAQDISLLDPYISTTQQAPIADALTTTASDWFLALFNVTAKRGHGSPLSDQSNSIHTLTGDNYQPFSLGLCLSSSIRGNNDTRPLALPLLPRANDPATANANVTLEDGHTILASIRLPGLSRADIMSDPGNSSQYRLRWVELPQPEFNGSSIGAIILLPRSESDMTGTQNITLCNLAAGWGTTTLQIQQFDGGASSVSSQIPSEFIEPGPTIGEYTANTPENINNLAYWWYTQFPQRPTNITSEWAQFLNPMVRSANRSVFDLIMQEVSPFADPGSPSSATVSANEVLVWLIANGLARIGFESVLQGSLKSVKSTDGSSWIDGNHWVSGKGNMFEVDPAQSKDWLKFHVNSTLEGYAYNTKTPAPRVAIGILTLYCVIALAHLIYSGISGISSTCWDSIAEVTALAMNSSPTTALRNTCAGITELHIFQLPVRVLAKPDEEGDGEHLELVFDEARNAENDGQLIKVNRAYGTMPLLKRRVW